MKICKMVETTWMRFGFVFFVVEKIHSWIQCKLMFMANYGKYNLAINARHFSFNSFKVPFAATVITKYRQIVTANAWFHWKNSFVYGRVSYFIALPSYSNRMLNWTHETRIVLARVFAFRITQNNQFPSRYTTKYTFKTMKKNTHTHFVSLSMNHYHCHGSH